ncbi:GFA family protein [Pseudoroseicyclus sp. H15]
MALTHVTGSCQCGAVRFEADVDMDHAVTCNCSRCQRLGAVFAFVPKGNFTQLSGEGEMTEYLFNTQKISHRFCKTCGIETFGFGDAPDGSAIVAINLNAVEGIDPRAVEATHYDGAAA